MHRGGYFESTGTKIGLSRLFQMALWYRLIRLQGETEWDHERAKTSEVAPSRLRLRVQGLSEARHGGGRAPGVVSGGSPRRFVKGS